MKRNLTDWETLERDAERGYEIMGREASDGWDIEVRFDNMAEPRRPEKRPASRAEAIQTGQELAKMG